MSAARRGLIHNSFSDKDPPIKQPINAPAEVVKTMFPYADAYRKRRCILTVDGFFEWKAIKGRQNQAVLCHLYGRRESVWDCRFVGKLEEPSHGALGPNVLRRDLSSQ